MCACACVCPENRPALREVTGIDSDLDTSLLDSVDRIALLYGGIVSPVCAYVALIRVVCVWMQRCSRRATVCPRALWPSDRGSD